MAAVVDVSWRIAPHTADLAIEAQGTDEGAALAAAATALTHVLTDASDPHALGSDQELRFRVEAPDHESLAVAFLSELLWLAEADGVLWTTGGVSVEPTQDGWAAEAAGNGIAYDPARHGRGTEVKAVTYHDLLSKNAGSDWQLRVLLDI